MHYINMQIEWLRIEMVKRDCNEDHAHVRNVLLEYDVKCVEMLAIGLEK